MLHSPLIGRFSSVLPWALLALAVVTTQARASEDSADYKLLGAGVRSRPAYDGSKSQTLELIPVIRYYGHPWFARTTQGTLEGGAQWEVASGLHAGAQLAYEGGRKQSESAFLRDHNIPDLDWGASAGAHLEWDGKLGPMPVNALLRYRQNLDSDRGAQTDLRFSAGVYGNHGVEIVAFAEGTWANAKSAESFYGITPELSASSGLPVFDAGSGFIYASAGFLWSADITREWVLVGSLWGRKLEGDAARSPLAERSSNYYISLGLAYRF
jgi:outer membrane scaffolding protein for murein synthesis (MipA/OmpV family)